MACPRKALHRAALGVGLFAATPRYRCGVSAAIPQAKPFKKRFLNNFPVNSYFWNQHLTIMLSVEIVKNNL